MFRELFLLSLLSIAFCDSPRIRNGQIPSIPDHHLNPLFYSEDALLYQSEDELISNEEVSVLFGQQNQETGGLDWNIHDWSHTNNADDMIAFTNNFDDFDVAEPFEPLPDDNAGFDQSESANNLNSLTGAAIVNQGPEIHYGHIDESNIVTRTANAAYSAIQGANNLVNQPEQTQAPPAPFDNPDNDDIFNTDYPLNQPNPETVNSDVPENLPPVSAYPKIVTRTARASYDAIESAKDVAQIQNNRLGSLYDDAANPVQNAVSLANNAGYTNNARTVTNDLNNLRGTGTN